MQAVKKGCRNFLLSLLVLFLFNVGLFADAKKNSNSVDPKNSKQHHFSTSEHSDEKFNGHNQKPIKAMLRAPFASPNILLELSEIIYYRNPSYYFNFIDYLSNNSDLFKKTPQESYEAGISWIRNQLAKPETDLDPNSIDWVVGLYDLDLSTHSKAPKLISQFQYYNSIIKKSKEYTENLKKINENKDSSEINSIDCYTWVWWNGKMACSQENLEKLVETDTFYGDTYKSTDNNIPVSLSFDHIYPANLNDKDTENIAILYGNPSSPNFSKLNSYLMHLSDLGNTKYTLRMIPPKSDDSDIIINNNPNGMEISGYSVTLFLKSTEYKVTDESDLFSNTDGEIEGSGSEWNFGFGELNELSYNSKKPKPFLEIDNNATVVENIDKESIKNLPKNIAEKVLSSPQPFEMLEWILTDFPKYTHLLTDPIQNKTFSDVLKKFPKDFADVQNIVTLNGMVIPEAKLNPFDIVDKLENERNIISSLQSLGLPNDRVIDFISSSFSLNKEKSSAGSDSDAIKFDITDKKEDRVVVGWLNDLSTDSRYKTWPSGLMSLLYSQSSSLPKISENIVSTVIALDFSSIEAVQFFMETILEAIFKNYPFRFGVVPMSSSSSASAVSNCKFCKNLPDYDFSDSNISKEIFSETSDPSDVMGRVFYYLYNFYGIRATSDYFSAILNLVKSKDFVNKAPKNSNLVLNAAKTTYESFFSEGKYKQNLKRINKLLPSLIKDKSLYQKIAKQYEQNPLSWEDIKSDFILSALMCKHNSYISRLDLILQDSTQNTSNNVNSSPKIIAFANGDEIDMSNFLTGLLTSYRKSSMFLLTGLLSGTIQNNEYDLLQLIISSSPNTSYRNPLITSKCFVDSTQSSIIANKKDQVGILSLHNTQQSKSQLDKVKNWISELKYLTILPGSDSSKIPTTVWLWADLDSTMGRNRVSESIVSIIDNTINNSKQSSGYRVSISHVPKSALKTKKSLKNINQEDENDQEDDEDEGDGSSNDSNTPLPVSNDGKLAYLFLRLVEESNSNDSYEKNLLTMVYTKLFLSSQNTDPITGSALISELKSIINNSKSNVDEKLADEVASNLNLLVSKVTESTTKEIKQYYHKITSGLSTLLKVNYGSNNWESVSVFTDGFESGDLLISVSGRIFPVVKKSQAYNHNVLSFLLTREYKSRIGGAEKAFIKLMSGSDSSIKNVQERKNIDTFLMALSSIEQSKIKSKSDSIFETGKVTDRVNIYEELKGYQDLTFETSPIKTKGGDSNIYAHFKAIINPISDSSQDIVPFLRTLSKIPGIKVSILVNPFSQPDSLPLRQFKRYVMNHKPLFNEKTGGSRVGVGAEFKGMPSESLLTLAMNVPSSWLVSATKSDYDLDNINLRSIDSKHGVAALFSLNSVLIEGHAQDSADRSPPSGLQVVLTNGPHLVSKQKNQVDSSIYNREAKQKYGKIHAETIVMANLGYFQLQAQFGVYSLSTRSGRSRRLYEMICLGSESYSKCNSIIGKKYTGNTESSNNYGVIMLDSFKGVTVYPVFSKRVGMEKQPILAPETENSFSKSASNDKGVIEQAKDMIGNLFGFKSNKVPEDEDENSDETEKCSTIKNKEGELVHVKEADLNIFAVASGHLYERLMSIMIASVIKHTNSTVKFWIIENFMSPSFKKFVPILAAQYNFQYEFVTYKWPHWLNSETEKQRTIWGYKILFLDVLFPLKLKRVIFVDADQIVRADLQDLSDTDLKGAPYGYVPFCDDKMEIEGYRFWKVGYWKTHLRGKPYHISALYVIDLQKFRELAAGDKLRYTYQSLSKDKNSLSNLDQDLPNNIQHQVPIFSLDQNWLWCETWCSNSGLDKAKTIDLCNNPMTKEPKLERAKRLIPEWNVYDAEIQKLRKTFNMESNSSNKKKLDEESGKKFEKQEL
ncbi:UDP-glucose:glycoprotein glucosyltransferase [Smittium culicis]|uniref:UDP-glucose:glycoprotein glucosyltransferase n=1 Tax=Smittium culicis TaxID=133412 RepID=A0A1R1YG32_9FUNG|nr:UDP-glucose:glycoprotein glucosyltransferase [Smittium culicis]